MLTITQYWIRHPKRGYSMYPSNGRMLTRIMVKLEGETVQRRVYDKVVGYTPGSRKAIFGPVIVLKDGEYRLTPEQITQIGYDFHTCRTYQKEEA